MNNNELGFKNTYLPDHIYTFYLPSAILHETIQLMF